MEEQIVGFALILVRVGGFIATFSLFSNRSLPNLVKVGLACALAVFWTSQLDLPIDYLNQFSQNNHWLPYVLAAGKELLVGILLATALGTLLIPLRIAGAYIGQEMGLSMAAISDPGSQDSSTIVAKFLETIGVVAFFMLDLHYLVILVMEHSFKGIPLDGNLMTLRFGPMIDHLSSLTGIGLGIAAPIGLLLFFTLVGLALLNKASPSLNLFSIGLTLRTGIGLVCLLIFLPSILHAAIIFFEKTQFEIENFVYAIAS